MCEEEKKVKKYKVYSSHVVGSGFARVIGCKHKNQPTYNTLKFNIDVKWSCGYMSTTILDRNVECEMFMITLNMPLYSFRASNIQVKSSCKAIVKAFKGISNYLLRVLSKFDLVKSFIFFIE